MLELAGMTAIGGALTGSALVALCVGEALINWIIGAMHAGVRRADQAAVPLSAQSQTAKLRSGRFERV